MKAMGRILLPLYLVIIVVSTVMAFSIRMSMSEGARRLMKSFAAISSILFVVAIAAAGIAITLLTIQRFYRNLLGSEGYLMFTLPVSTLEHIISKAVSALVWITAGVAAGFGSGLIIVSIVSDLPEFMREFKMAWDTLTQGEGNLALRIVLTVIMLLAGILESLFKVYASIAVGHQWGNHRVFGAIAAYIGFSVIELILTSRNLFGRFLNTAQEAGLYWQTGGFIIALAGIAVYGFITWYLLDHRLNLE